MFGETPSPTFKALMAGVFQVTATAAGKSAQAKVIVPQGLRPNPNETPIRTVQVSTRDLPTTTTTPVPQAKNKRQNSPSSRKSQIASAKMRTDRRSAHALSAGVEESTAVSSKTTAPEAALSIAPIPQGGGTGGSDGTNYWSADDPPNPRGNPPGGPLAGCSGIGSFQA